MSAAAAAAAANCRSVSVACSKLSPPRMIWVRPRRGRLSMPSHASPVASGTVPGMISSCGVAPISARLADDSSMRKTRVWPRSGRPSTSSHAPASSTIGSWPGVSGLLGPAQSVPRGLETGTARFSGATPRSPVLVSVMAGASVPGSETVGRHEVAKSSASSIGAARLSDASRVCPASGGLNHDLGFPCASMVMGRDESTASAPSPLVR